MREVGAFEAKNRWSALLADVARGEEITITLRGKPVARLVPAEPKRDEAEMRAAIARLRERARSLSLAPVSVEEWIAFRDEGRR